MDRSRRAAGRRSGGGSGRRAWCPGAGSGAGRGGGGGSPRHGLTRVPASSRRLRRWWAARGAEGAPPCRRGRPGGWAALAPGSTRLDSTRAQPACALDIHRGARRLRGSRLPGCARPGVGSAAALARCAEFGAEPLSLLGLAGSRLPSAPSPRPPARPPSVPPSLSLSPPPAPAPSPRHSLRWVLQTLL